MICFEINEKGAYMNMERHQKTCSVNKASLFKEITNNTQKPLEILREAISNSIDANAQNILIEMYVDPETNLFVLKIKDDGDGMSIRDIDDFFSLGSSKAKQPNKIGEKGLGTKTYFKSKKVEIYTQKDGIRHYAVLNNPWEKIQSGLDLGYSVEKLAQQTNMDGTEILIHDYQANNLHKSHFNFSTMKDYILWYTAAGSFKTQFSNVKELRHLINNIHISPMIKLVDRISGESIEFVGEHPFEEPDENPVATGENLFDRTDNFSKRFGPYHRTDMINGKYVSFQIFGTVSGVSKRNQIINFGPGQRHRSRFGLNFCKDFIPFLNMKEFLLDDNNYSHYHLLINSQNFELTSDRNNMTNSDSLEIQWIIEEAKKLIRDKITSVAKDTYFAMKLNEEMRAAIFQRKMETQKRLNALHEIDDIYVPGIGKMKKPRMESQVLAIMLSLLASNNIEGLRVVEYSSRSSTDLILMDESNTPILAEVEFKLSSLIKHEHPIETLDQIWCWTIDVDLDQAVVLGENAISIVKIKNEHYLKYGTEKMIRIFEISRIIEGIMEKKEN